MFKSTHSLSFSFYSSLFCSYHKSHEYFYSKPSVRRRFFSLSPPALKKGIAFPSSLSSSSFLSPGFLFPNLAEDDGAICFIEGVRSRADRDGVRLLEVIRRSDWRVARFTSILKKSSPVLPRPGVDFRSKRSALSLKPLVVVGVCACLRSFRLTTLALSSFLAASSRMSSRICTNFVPPRFLQPLSQRYLLLLLLLQSMMKCAQALHLKHPKSLSA